MTEPASRNADPAEVSKFESLAASWWDPEGPQRPLHDLNPVRCDYIADLIELHGARLLDVGCGAGLASEALVQRGATVTGIDLAEKALKVARLHRHESGVEVDYQLKSAEELADEEPGDFDAVICLEMLEHVPDPESVVHACARLLRPGGRVVFSTINRSPKAFALAIAGAEYLLGLVERGTHEYAKFIRPSELAAAARRSGLDRVDISGLHYNPFSRKAWLARDVSVNYLACFERRGEPDA